MLFNSFSPFYKKEQYKFVTFHNTWLIKQFFHQRRSAVADILTRADAKIYPKQLAWVTPIPSKVPFMLASTYCKCGMQEGLHIVLF